MKSAFQCAGPKEGYLPVARHQNLLGHQSSHEEKFSYLQRQSFEYQPKIQPQHLLLQALTPPGNPPPKDYHDESSTACFHPGKDAQHQPSLSLPQLQEAYQLLDEVFLYQALQTNPLPESRQQDAMFSCPPECH